MHSFTSTGDRCEWMFSHHITQVKHTTTEVCPSVNWDSILIFTLLLNLSTLLFLSLCKSKAKHVAIISLAETLWRFLPCVSQDWAGGFVDWVRGDHSAAPPHYLQNNLHVVNSTIPLLKLLNIYKKWATNTHSLQPRLTHRLSVLQFYPCGKLKLCFWWNELNHIFCSNSVLKGKNM